MGQADKSGSNDNDFHGILLLQPNWDGMLRNDYRSDSYPESEPLNRGRFENDGKNLSTILRETELFRRPLYRTKLIKHNVPQTLCPCQGGAAQANMTPAARRPISTAKFVPRSHGYTWLMLAKNRLGNGVRMSGMCREWLTSGTGWA